MRNSTRFHSQSWHRWSRWMMLSLYHFRRAGRAVITLTPWVLVGVVMVGLSVSLWNLAAVAIIVQGIESNNAADALAATSALTSLAFGHSLVTFLVTFGTVIWGAFAYFVYRATELVVGALYILLYPIDVRYMRAEQHYDLFLRRHLRWQLRMVLLLFLVIFGVLLGTRHWENIVQDRLEPVITSFGLVLIAVVPVAYGVVWAKALSLSRTRVNAHGLATYLFSSSARRHHFLSLMTVLVFFAELVWLLFPALFAWSEGASGWVADLIRGTLEYDSHFAAASPPAQSQLLVAPDSLSLKFNPFSSLLLSARAAVVRDMLLLWFFVVSLTAGFLGIAIPATVAAVHSVGYRRALQDVAVKTAKSTFVSGVLGLLVEYGYRVDTRRGLVWLAIFGFVLSFLFAHDDVLASHMERQTVFDDAG